MLNDAPINYALLDDVFVLLVSTSGVVYSGNLVMTNLHVADVGAQIIATLTDTTGVAQDISQAIGEQIIFEKPDGSLLTVTASFVTDGSDGVVRYIFGEGDLDQSGTWRYQALITFASGEIYSDVAKFKVLPNLPI